MILEAKFGDDLWSGSNITVEILAKKQQQQQQQQQI